MTFLLTEYDVRSLSKPDLQSPALSVKMMGTPSEPSRSQVDAFLATLVRIAVDLHRHEEGGQA